MRLHSRSSSKHTLAATISLTVESLEARQLFYGPARHVELAELMVKTITPANNMYSYAAPVVTWKGINGATKTYNKSDCSSFTTELLQTAYKFSNQQFINWTGESDPEAEDYYKAAVNDRGFDGFYDVDNVKTGDLMVMKYTDSNDTGHVVTIVAPPKFVKQTATQKVYTLKIVDCTGSPHGSSDTRYKSGDNGVGQGYMRIYTDLNGNLKKYSWNNYANGIVSDPATHKPIFAHIPKITVSTPADLTATRATVSGKPQINLKWKDNSTLEDGYLVQRRVAGASTWSVIADLAKNTKSYTDKNVTAGVQYEYRVVGTLYQFESKPSNSVKLKA